MPLPTVAQAANFVAGKPAANCRNCVSKTSGEIPFACNCSKS